MLVNASCSLQSLALTTGFGACSARAFALSDQISQRYFSHASSASQSLNA
jgi:hypothetical protein